MNETGTDTARLNWMEKNHTLHRCVEILYVVDGYEVQITHDDFPVGPAYSGETMRAAIDAAMADQP